MRIGLGKRLIILIVLMIIGFGLLFMIVNIVVFRKNANEDFEKKINYIADFTAGSNSANMWNFDYINIQKFMESLLTEKTLTAVIFEVNTAEKINKKKHFLGLVAGELVDKDAESLQLVEPQPGTFSHHIERTIIYQNMEVGKVHLFFSNKFIILDTKEQAKTFFINMIIFVILFSLAIYFALKRHLLTPITKIHQLALSVSGFTSYLSESVSQERWQQVQQLLVLERANQERIKGKIRDDELGDFMQAFLLVLNGFEFVVSELSQYSSQLQLMNEDLEERINKRTAELEYSNDQISESLKVLQQTQGQLIQQEKLASIGQLAAGVAHEINNPIGYVGSNINRLDEYFNDLRLVLTELDKMLGSLPPDSTTELVSHINKIKKQIDYDFLIDDFAAVISDCREGITRVKDIVQSLKDFSHNVDEKEFSDIDINDAIKTTLKVVNNEIKYCSDVVLELNLTERVSANLGQMHQVISNLVVNASHAMKVKPTRGLLTIRTYKDDNFAYIDIQDTGNGIPEDIRTKIFDPFFTTKPIGQGTGLGLNICYDIIVNKHKGDLSFESEISVGTVFKIKLPLTTGLVDADQGSSTL